MDRSEWRINCYVKGFMSSVRRIQHGSRLLRHFDIARCGVISSIHYSTSKYNSNTSGSSYSTNSLLVHIKYSTITVRYLLSGLTVGSFSVKYLVPWNRYYVNTKLYCILI